jgi:hypothetical protein
VLEGERKGTEKGNHVLSFPSKTIRDSRLRSQKRGEKTPTGVKMEKKTESGDGGERAEGKSRYQREPQRAEKRIKLQLAIERRKV